MKETTSLSVLIDAAVTRALKTWKTSQEKRDAIERALQRLPYRMQWSESWKGQAAKIAFEALTDVRSDISSDEMVSLARAALQPLILEFEHAQKVEDAINSVRIPGGNYDEISEALETVREALAGLPKGATDRQITQAKDHALKPLLTRITERVADEQREQQRKNVMASVSWRLPLGISDPDRKDAMAEIEEALDALPVGSSERDMETTRDLVIEEYQEDYRRKAKLDEAKAAKAKKKA
jgi:hypothetical protein